jgi:hypothetical protein
MPYGSSEIHSGLIRQNGLIAPFCGLMYESPDYTSTHDFFSCFPHTP